MRKITCGLLDMSRVKRMKKIKIERWIDIREIYIYIVK